jgi:molecular chaperone HtpG
MDNAEQFLPLYLRFIKGVVDSSDLPLNVSRELLQQDEQVEAMRSALTRRALELLARLASEDAGKYAGFWKEFGRVLKEGLSEDAGNRERILPLLRYASTNNAGDEQSVSLADYVARMQPGQERIYYVIGENHAAARGSAHIEQLRHKGIEVLLLGDRIDEWVMGQLGEFSGKRFKDAARGDLELGGLADAADKARADAALKQSKGLLKRCKDTLGDRVREVRPSVRLADSPVCLVRDETELSESMRRLLQAQGQAPPPAAATLEINVQHPLVRYLDTLPPGEVFNELTGLLYDQARLNDCGQVDQPAEFSRRLNSLLVRLAGVQ